MPRTQFDQDSNGTSPSIIQWAWYDSDGNLVGQEEDFNATVTSVGTHEYTVSFNLIRCNIMRNSLVFSGTSIHGIM